MGTEKERPPKCCTPVGYLSPKQAARLTGYTEKALERRRQRGNGPPYSKVGKSIRYAVADPQAWMEAGHVE